MGVFGLTGHCNEHVSAASTLENLSEISRERKARGDPAPALIVDGYGLLHIIFEEVMPGWQWILGGEFYLLDARLREWIGRLNGAGLEVIFTFDPAQGTEQEDRESNEEGRKANEMKKRFAEKCAEIGKVVRLIHEGEELGDWSDKEVGVKWQLPHFSRWQTLSTLKSLGIPPPPCPPVFPSSARAFIPVDTCHLRADGVLRSSTRTDHCTFHPAADAHANTACLLQNLFSSSPYPPLVNTPIHIYTHNHTQSHTIA